MVPMGGKWVQHRKRFLARDRWGLKRDIETTKDSSF
jgi:hypothetical protein